MIDLNTGKQTVEMMKRKGLVGEIAGGIFKQKPYLKDIDLVVKEKDVLRAVTIVTAMRVKDQLNVPVEVYTCSDDMYDRLLSVLRTSTYIVINNRLMTGLRFRKVRI